MNKYLLIFLFFTCAIAKAQIPSSVPFASGELGNITTLASLQFMNLDIINDVNTSTSSKGRVNSWLGVYSNSTIGNYTSNYNKIPAINEIWTMVLYSDGRFRIAPYARLDLCISFDTITSDFSAKEFGRNGKRVYLAECSSSSRNQQFFLQESTSTKAAPAGVSYVIRSINFPDLCLATMNNSKKSASLSPLTMQDCQPYSRSFDRWRITNYADINNTSTAKTLHLMATLFALHNYTRIMENGTNEFIYNNNISTTLSGNFFLLPVLYYRKIPFMNPFDGSNLDVFYNGTPSPQELHIERFKTEGFDKSIEIGAKISVPIFNWSIDAKGKLDFKSSTQLNTKLWLKVDPYSAMWFTSSLSKASGTYNIEIITDLNDSWSINGINFSQELVNSLIVCTSTSTDPICIQSAYSSD